MPNPQMAGQIGYDLAGNPMSAQQWNAMQRQNNPSLWQRAKEIPGKVGSAIKSGAQAIGAIGTPGHVEHNPRFPEKFQGPYEQVYGNLLNRLNENITNPGGPNPLLDPIMQQAIKRYQTETVPGIAHFFTSLGGEGAPSGSDFRAALASSGTNLNENLAALKAQYTQAERQQLFNQLQNTPYENTLQPATEGWGPKALQLGLDIGAAYLDPVSALGKAAVKGYNTFRSAGGSIVGSQGNIQPQQQQMIPQQIPQIVPEQQGMLADLYQRAQQQNYRFTPQDVQILQALRSGNAAEDFARTFRQPQSKQITFPRSADEQARYAGFLKAGVL